MGIKERITLEVNTENIVEDFLHQAKFDYVNSGITSEHFPIRKRGIEEFELVLFGPDDFINTSELIVAISQQGFQQASIEHLFALAIELPDLQRKGNPIIGFGSIWTRAQNEKVVPVLRGGDQDRNMHLLRINSRWNPCERFAGIRLVVTDPLIG